MLFSVINFFKKRFLKIKKRLRFVFSALSLSFLMLISTFFFFDKALLFVPILILAAFFLTYFSILEGIEKIEWLTLFLMPIVLTISFYFFYFLFPVRWLTRLPFIIIYTVSIYAILLTANIFNVGVEKSLQLYRAAFSVNFFYQTLIVFFLFNIILSFHLNFLINGFLIGGVGFLMALQLFWTVRLTLYWEKEVVFSSLVIFLILLELAIVFSFVPLKTVILALFLTAVYYSLGGLIYNFLDKRLFKETIKEYLLVLFFVFLIVLLTISW